MTTTPNPASAADAPAGAPGAPDPSQRPPTSGHTACADEGDLSTGQAPDDEFPVADEDLIELHRRLAEEATAAGTVDVAYRTLATPIGTLLLAATPTGLVQVAFEVEDHDAVLERVADRVSPRILEAPARLDPVVVQLEQYFAGRRTRFEVPLDFTMSGGFRLEVQRHLPDIDYGRTRTYREVAEAVGNPRAVRAVGSACATNPLPIVVPCHRVLRSDGSLGGYRGGLEAKATLLRLESDH